MEKNATFELHISQEPEQLEIYPLQEKVFCFTVTNQSRRPVTVRPGLMSLKGPVDDERDPIASDLWREWLTVLDDEEVSLMHNTSRQIRVRITPPKSPRIGAYSFRLGMIGMEDPDEQLEPSDAVQFAIPEKATPFNMRRWGIIGGMVLALLLLIIAGITIFSTPRPRLTLTLHSPDTVAAQDLIEYQLEITNKDALEAHNIILEYRLPAEIVEAYARVEEEDFRQCDGMAQRRIACGLGTLGEGETVSVTIRALAAPQVKVVTNQEVFTVTAQFINNRRIDTDQFFPELDGTIEVAITPAGQPLVAHAMPSIDSAAVGETILYQLVAWHTVTGTQQQLWGTYQLPKGMRYASRNWPDAESPLAEGQCRPAPEDYFTLLCYMGQREAFAPAQLRIGLIPDEPLFTLSEQIEQHFGVALGGIEAVEQLTAIMEAGRLPSITSLAEGEAPGEIVATQLVTQTSHIVDSTLIFDGFDDYVDLGFNQKLDSFMIDMWVTPYSMNNNQALIGLHFAPQSRTTLPCDNRGGETEIREGSNLFLVGFYNDGLDVRVGPCPEDHHTFAVERTTERFHLAVAVENDSSQKSLVYVYVNGELQRPILADGETLTDCEPQCKVYPSSLTQYNIDTLNWVVGQDWDAGNPDKHPSDYFQGGISDLRIWNTASKRDNVLALRQRHIILPDEGATDVLAYWPLTPSFDGLDQESVEAFEDSVHTLSFNPFESAVGGRPHVVADPQTGRALAAIYGSGWGESEARFGNALRFDGERDGLVSTFDLMPTSVAGSDTLTVSLTLGSWIYVNSVPTEDQWIVGYAPLESLDVTTAGTAGVVGEAQTVLDSLGEVGVQLGETLDNTIQQNSGIQEPLNDAQVAQNEARQNSVDALRTLLGYGSDPTVVIDGNGETVILYHVQPPGSAKPSFAPIAVPGLPGLPTSAISKLLTFDLTYEERIEALFLSREAAEQAAEQALLSLEATGTAAQTEVDVELARLEAARDELEQLSEIVNSVDALREEAILTQQDFDILVSSGQVGFAARRGVTVGVGGVTQEMIDTLYYLELVQQNTAVHQANLAYLQGLTQLDETLTQSERSGSRTALAAQQNHVTIQVLADPASMNNNTLATLREWVNRTYPAAQSAPLRDTLDTLEEKNSEVMPLLQQRATNSGQQQAALFKIHEVNQQQAVLNGLIQEYNSTIQQRTNLLQQRQQLETSLDGADDPQQVQIQLNQIDEQIAQQRQDLLTDLELELASLQAQEEILSQLDPVLQTAVSEAYDAGREAVEQQALESIVDKILAQFLGIQPCAIPAATSREAIFEAAELAVRLSVLNDAEDRVVLAEENLAQVTQQQQCRQSQINGARESLKATLIQLLENYLQAINAEVNRAAQELEDAQAALQEDEAESQLVLPDDLLDLIAQAIATEVSNDLNNYLCEEGFAFDHLVCGGDSADSAGGLGYNSQDVPRNVPAVGDGVSFLKISGGPDEISEVAVNIRLQHPYINDLQFVLISPDKKAVTLLDIQTLSCGRGNNINVIFDDKGAAAAAGSCAALSNGSRLQPGDPLNSFKGDGSNGTWTLVVRDKRGASSGVLVGWSLDIQGVSAEEKTTQEAESFLTVFNNLRRFQSGEVTQALNERHDNVIVTLSAAINNIRFEKRWQTRIKAALAIEQLQLQLQEGIANAAEQQSARLLQLVLKDIDGTLRVLLNESTISVASVGDLEPDIETAVQELERRERFQTLLNDLNRLTEIARQQLNIISIANTSGGPSAAIINAPLPLPAQMGGTLRLEPSAPFLSDASATTSKVRILGKRQLLIPVQQGSGEGEEEGAAGSEAGAGETDGTPAEGAAEDAPAENETAVMESAATRPINVWFGLVLDSDGHMTLVAKPEGATEWTFLKENIPVPTNAWHHYAGSLTFTISEENLSTPTLVLYRDGEVAKVAEQGEVTTHLRFDTSCASHISAGNPIQRGLHVGRLCDGFHFEGEIDDIRLWQRVLSKFEVIQWMGRPRETFNEFLYWSFDEGPGTNRCHEGMAPLRNVACDNARDGNNFVVISGPKWINADVARFEGRE